MSGTRQELLRCRVSGAVENRTDLLTLRCDHGKAPGSFLTNNRPDTAQYGGLCPAGRQAEHPPGAPQAVKRKVGFENDSFYFSIVTGASLSK